MRHRRKNTRRRTRGDHRNGDENSEELLPQPQRARIQPETQPALERARVRGTIPLCGHKQQQANNNYNNNNNNNYHGSPLFTTNDANNNQINQTLLFKHCRRRKNIRLHRFFKALFPNKRRTNRTQQPSMSR